jgi:hypothetical protein
MFRLGIYRMTRPGDPRLSEGRRIKVELKTLLDSRFKCRVFRRANGQAGELKDLEAL